MGNMVRIYNRVPKKEENVVQSTKLTDVKAVNSVNNGNYIDIFRCDIVLLNYDFVAKRYRYD